MNEIFSNCNCPLFQGICPEDRAQMLGCIGYHIATFRKGDIVAFEEEHIRHVGILLCGCVDMVKEDIWGNKSMLERLHENDLFGEAFACGSDSLSFVTFIASAETKILFIPFDRVMHNCAQSCAFHHRLIENMVRVIADKNYRLMRKVEVVSKRTIREKVLTYLSIRAQTEKSHYFDIPLNRTELADYLCVDRSALTRELAKMKEEHLIDYDKNCFRLK